MKPATLRFSGRVENYIKYRPGYPSGVIETLRERVRINRAFGRRRHRIGYGHSE